MPEDDTDDRELSSIAGGVLVVGGAGFIGSHFVDRLLGDPGTGRVTVYDNLSSGRTWHFVHHEADERFAFVKGDAGDGAALQETMAGHEVVIHLASNPDIARAMTEPAIDFDEGTVLTHQIVEAMRITGARRILYASGSGVYGELGEVEASEDHGPLEPASTYGASKLAGEALIAAYCHMFGITACAFRFGNVVGARQTHGVGFDFLRRLLDNPRELRILGDGSQSKSYIAVGDVVSAVLLAHGRCVHPFSVFNVATGDYITVTEIAELACRALELDRAAVNFSYTGGDRGWVGDVPVVRLATERIRALGWQPSTGSAGALVASFAAMLPEMRAGRL